ncbi:hypothetical protein Cpir12675_006398 [Ceratocystis pirilliformis]|uniref:Uncharacterized protein n=1 Tax=Ceratocystis pirilliformis TaxID=259994 RepID=A0ABR3YII1_9PEZI
MADQMEVMGFVQLERYSTAPHQYQNPADVNRRNDRMEYSFAQSAQPGSHPHSSQQPMAVPQQPNQSQAPTQQSTQQTTPVSVPVPVPSSQGSSAQQTPQQQTQQQPPQQQTQAQAQPQVQPLVTTPGSTRNRKRTAPGAVPQTPTSASSIAGTAVTVSPITAPLSTTDQVAPPTVSGTVSAGTHGTDAVTPATPAPPAKKSRTNTPWTPAEELRLKQMRDAGNSWAEIAKTFPARTEGSVKKHWYKDMHYAEFAEDESHALLNAMKEYENNRWKFIGQKVGKPAKACEQYAKEHFPDQFPPNKQR